MRYPFFSADHHFDHFNIIKYANRPFSSLEEMNETLVANWNAVVSPEDLVYYLGDFAFHRHGEFIKRLNGHKVLIIGSHDKELREFYRPWAFEEATPLKEINLDSQHVTLCHYCMRVWPRSHHGAWHLYAHSHGDLEPIGKSWDVGVDNNNYFPVSWEQIKKIMAGRPDNFNHHMQEKSQ